MAEIAQLSRPARSAPHRSRRATPRQRYMAFLSYSHNDSATAEWLHESLERFKVPPRLVGQLTSQGAIPRRLTPIFRDRQELAVSSDLGEEIEDAIAGSRFLIVLCSPAAVQSRWIDEEIACFKRLNGEDRVIAAIVEGEPFASDMPGHEAEECFPLSLRTHYDRRGRPTDQRSEPIAADLREGGDGRKLGLLKIAAGLLGVGLDDLAQRDAQRRHRRQSLITAASIAGMIVTGGLAYTAIEARDEAHFHSQEADKLVGFMLGDLREKLAPLGRLDLMDSVGARALAYYEGQNKGSLSDAALAQRSRALTLMGEMAQARGDLDGALRRYREALNGTAEALRREPDNPRNLFNHAQNVFWVGYIDYLRGDLEKAAAAFRDYRVLADRMVELEPGNQDYQLEQIYAETNLGTVLMDQRRYRDAAATFQRLMEPVEALVVKNARDPEFQIKLINSLAWLADAREFSGQIDDGIALRQRQLGLIAELWDPDKPSTALRRDEMTARRAVARMLSYRGRMPQSIDQARQAAKLVDWLMRTEPNNTEWMQAGAQTNFDRAALELAAGNAAGARSAADSACAASTALLARDRSVTMWRTTLQLRCAKIKGLIALHLMNSAEAQSQARRALTIARGEEKPIERGLAIAESEMLLSHALAMAGQASGARAANQRALTAWPTDIEEQPREIANRALLLRQLGRAEEANRLVQRLAAMGFQHPSYTMVQRPVRV
ncbi:toll/interleukin-1 receptor domain-containing protein [Sphingomonas xanthus]|uniref:Toll/interleukin-1 receptor domain-containing protein n=1 Tax=Sphingomonas xanthus TaxID=2594473 RepID=A0A516IRW3_9SPHN|nr:toll/interleukin-1 receptor domain-containing protein [Sphingomonas xanthus]QDP19635.1 toll/interleukin-1 receptor domain-containing protein [Sphingomonas xanthus]